MPGACQPDHALLARRMVRSHPAPALLAAALLAPLAACGPPAEVVAARGAPSNPDLPAPALLPTENFDEALAAAEADTTRLDAETDALAARAAALEARAASLSAPVIPPADAARLEAATANPPQIPAP